MTPKLDNRSFDRRQFLTMMGAGAAVLVGCQPEPAARPPAEQPKPASIPRHVFALSSEPTSLDPHESRDSNARRVVRAMFDTLVDESPDGTQIVPNLAESWTISQDGLTYTFKLRQGVKFHDGTGLDAEAVKFSIDRQIDPNNPYNKMGSFGNALLFLSEVKSVDVVDPATVRFNLKAPWGALLDYLTNTVSCIVSPNAVKKWEKDFREHPVGTGPYVFQTWRKGQDVTMTRNNEYWGKKPLPERLVAVPIVEEQGRVAALDTGTVDIIGDLPPDQIAALKANSRYRVTERVSRQFWAVWMNTKGFEPFTKLPVRQAISHAINRQAIVGDVVKGTAAIAMSPVSQAFGPWRNDQVQQFPFDPTKAKQLLAEAGYPNGFPVKLLIPESGPQQQSPRPMAAVIQANLNAVGISTTIEVLEYAAYIQRFYAGNYELASGVFASVINDPDNIMFNIFHSSKQPPKGVNVSFFESAEFDKLIEEARVIGDQPRRMDLYKRAQAILVAAAPAVWVDHEISYLAMNRNISATMMANFNVDIRDLTAG